MLIGELADAVRVPSQTLRFYERKGLLPEPGCGANGYRVYDESTLTRLHFIRLAQAAGLTLAEIRSIIDIHDEGARAALHARGGAHRPQAHRRPGTHQTPRRRRPGNRARSTP